MNSENFLCRNDVVDAVEIPRAIDACECMEKTGFVSAAAVGRRDAETHDVAASVFFDARATGSLAAQRYRVQADHAGHGDAPARGIGLRGRSRQLFERVVDQCVWRLALLVRTGRGTVMSGIARVEAAPEKVCGMFAKAVCSIEIVSVNCRNSAWRSCVANAHGLSASVRSAH